MMNKTFLNALFFKHLYLLATLTLLSSCDFLKYFQDSTTNTPTTATTATSYIISVYLESPSLEFAELLVITAPEGSKFQDGAVISKIPGQIVLDKAGTWQLQARSSDLESEVVTLRIPEEYSVTVTMP